MYLSNGEELSMHTFKNNVEANTIYYRDNIEICNNDVIVNHSNGRIVYENGSTNGEYQYYLKDHLGNIRLTFSDKNNDGKATKNEVISENHYYPFGLKMEGDWNSNNTANPEVTNQYNGKEWVDDLGLNMNDYGARWYDPAIARWSSVDPLAEKYVGHSPYNYVLGNPVKYIDPDGERVYIRAELTNTLTDLARIGATSDGRLRLRALIDANHMNFTIDNFFWTADAKYDAFGRYGRKQTIYYPNFVWNPIREGFRVNTYISLGHELNHAYDHFKDGSFYDIHTLEKSSVEFANYLRSAYDKYPMRRNYRGLNVDIDFEEKLINSRQEKISNFKEVESIEKGNLYLKGFSYDVGFNTKRPLTRHFTSGGYILSYAIGKKYQFQHFSTFEDYEKAKNKLLNK